MISCWYALAAGDSASAAGGGGRGGGGGGGAPITGAACDPRGSAVVGDRIEEVGGGDACEEATSSSLEVTAASELE